MSKPLKKTDPCYWMLEEGLKQGRGPHDKPIHREGCYICEDPEFSIMGLPLCQPCVFCKGHVPADDPVCDDCGKDQESW